MLKLRKGWYQDLSIQLLVDIVPRCFLTSSGAIIQLEHALNILRDVGTIPPEMRPLTYNLEPTFHFHRPLLQCLPLVKISDFKVFTASDFGSESDFKNALVDELSFGLVLASIPVFPSYINLFGFNDIYCPTQEELSSFHTAKLQFWFHCMVLTGHGVDSVGNMYWEFQESQRLNWGVNGFIKICRLMGVVVNFVVMAPTAEDALDM